MIDEIKVEQVKEIKVAEKVPRKKKTTKLELESEGEAEFMVIHKKKVTPKKEAASKKKSQKLESESEGEAEVKVVEKEKPAPKKTAVSKKKKVESESETEVTEIEKIKDVPKQSTEKPKTPAKPVASFFTKMPRKEVKTEKPEEVKAEPMDTKIKAEIVETGTLVGLINSINFI